LPSFRLRVPPPRPLEKSFFSSDLFFTLMLAASPLSHWTSSPWYSRFARVLQGSSPQAQGTLPPRCFAFGSPLHKFFFYSLSFFKKVPPHFIFSSNVRLFKVSRYGVFFEEVLPPDLFSPYSRQFSALTRPRPLQLSRQRTVPYPPFWFPCDVCPPCQLLPFLSFTRFAHILPFFGLFGRFLFSLRFLGSLIYL